MEKMLYAFVGLIVTGLIVSALPMGIPVQEGLSPVEANGKDLALMQDDFVLLTPAWGSTQEKETRYEMTGRVLSLSSREITVLDRSKTPVEQYRFILPEGKELSEAIKIGSIVQVTYTSNLEYFHHRTRTALSVELVGTK